MSDAAIIARNPFDVMVIPAGVPHWFKEVPKEINYYVVKVIKP